MQRRFLNIILIALFSLLVVGESYGARLKDMSQIKGVRENMLLGYGLVVGLNGTGDKAGADFTLQSIANMLENQGISVNKGDLTVKNVAAVMITAKLPPFARKGSLIDVLVSTIGDAKSLQGGTLLMTPILGPDGKVYAVAQGPLSVGGFAAGGALTLPDDSRENLLETVDGGLTWIRSSGPQLPNVYGLAVTKDGESVALIAVGPKGMDVSFDGGLTWNSVDKRNYWSVQFVGHGTAVAVGPRGRVTRVNFLRDHR